MYANNLQAAASILLSGNNFTKIERMFSFLGLSFMSDSTFYRMQRLYLIPCINEWWNWQRDQPASVIPQVTLPKTCAIF